MGCEICWQGRRGSALLPATGRDALILVKIMVKLVACSSQETFRTNVSTLGSRRSRSQSDLPRRTNFAPLIQNSPITMVTVTTLPQAECRNCQQEHISCTYPFRLSEPRRTKTGHNLTYSSPSSSSHPNKGVNAFWSSSGQRGAR